MRIFRTLILVTGLGVFMPSPPEETTQQAAASDAGQSVLGSATLAVADMVGFCSRQPGVCQTAGYVAGRLEAKAKYSVRLIYEWANESSGGPRVSPLGDQLASDPMKTGSTALADGSAAPAGQSTLRLEDLIPEWRGPASPHKKS